MTTPSSRRTLSAPVLRLRVTLLGVFEARLGAGRRLRFPTKKTAALLAYLAGRAGERLPREHLATVFWGDAEERRARQSLRHALSALRKVLADGTRSALIIDRDCVSVDPALVEIDVVTLERAARERRPEDLTRAAMLCQRDLLEGFDVGGTLFDEWVTVKRERIRRTALEVLTLSLEHRLRTGAEQAVIDAATRMLTIDPLDEAAHRALMRLFSRRGQRPRALRQYETCARALRHEFGIDPDSETQRLHEEILRAPAANAIARRRAS